MTQGRSSLTALDDILSQTRHLLLSFNGPVCPLFTDTPDMAIAEHLRNILTKQNGEPPAEIEETPDWQRVLAYAGTISPQLAETVESELTKLEAAAAQTTEPTPHLHELVSACRESGRSLAVISTTSAAVVRSYLAAHSLENAIGAVSARTSPTLVTPIHQIEQTIESLKATPSECALVTASTDEVNAARRTGAHSIGYSRNPDSHNALVRSEAGSTISSLADITLRIRALRPNV